MPRTGRSFRGWARVASIDTATDRRQPGGRLSADLRDRGVGQQHALLPHLAEPDGGFGVVAVAARGDHHALAPALVLHGVAGDDRRHLAPGYPRYRRTRPVRLHRHLAALSGKPHDAVAGAPVAARAARPGVP